LTEFKLGTEENPRHILGLSGGKDSTALAIHLKETRPEVFDRCEFYFTDTGAELPELYDYLEKLEKYLGRPIYKIKAEVGESKKIGFKEESVEDKSVPFDDVLFNKYNGFLPAPNARWCTRDLKIIPMEKWIGNDHCVSYVGIRADEPSREGYKSRSKNVNITAVYPFREDGLEIKDIYRLLEESVGIPPYYRWKTRSGCFFCFYSRRVEFSILYYLYPKLFKEAQKYETEHEDGRQFTWVKDKPLEYVANNAQDIIKRYIKKQYKKAPDTYKEGFKLTIEEMLQMIDEGRVEEFVDTWDLKRLHDVDGENKDGCTVCAI
jgi:3'-phosphoadenosine 5'-phosphosulfate sulfotransferase (PAPS reductase)/FAD synthetase